jgi:hypothetical protein
MVACELVYEQNRDTSTGFLEIQIDVVVGQSEGHNLPQGSSLVGTIHSI